jgi:hypothetical protein
LNTRNTWHILSSFSDVQVVPLARQAFPIRGNGLTSLGGIHVAQAVCCFLHVVSARWVVAELVQAGVARGQIDTIAKPGVDITELPVANQAQRADRV